MKHHITFTVNGDEYSIAVDPWQTLNEVLREDLNLTVPSSAAGPAIAGPARSWWTIKP